MADTAVKAETAPPCAAVSDSRECPAAASATGSAHSVEVTIGTGVKYNNAEDVKPIVDKLQGAYTTVRFSDNTFGIAACEAIAAQLQKNPALQVAHLDNMFTGRTLKEIPQALGALLSSIADHEHLYHVDCSGNAIGMAASPQIATFLKTNKSCRELILNNNGLSPEAGGLISQALSEGSLDLEVFCSQKNRWETKGIVHLAKALKGLSKLKKLDVSRNGVGQDGSEDAWPALFPALENHPDLHELNICDNYVKRRGVQALIKSLPHYKSLRILKMSDCFCYKRHAALFLEGLCTGAGSQLETLYLDYAEADSKFMPLLLRALKCMPNLKVLSVQGNHFSSEHIEQLRECLGEHAQILDEDCDGSEWSTEEEEEEEESSAADENDDEDEEPSKIEEDADSEHEQTTPGDEEEAQSPTDDAASLAASVEKLSL
mmetsp:Transcript_52363/g.131546  ORF Transcript_52363/g.131546 Transcript_52363/m.131546 type:complete len:432 (-) Transcript_52363:67-1362(-)